MRGRLAEDPVLKCSGPLWVDGGIRFIGADGRIYEHKSHDSVPLHR
jgi:hypothetical protein